MFVCEVPTKLRRVNATLEPELYAALEAYANRCKRSLSNQVSVILEQALINTGDLPGPVDRQEKRGGKRPNAGRKASDVQAPDTSSDDDQAPEAIDTN
jgi:hypothetical protein